MAVSTAIALLESDLGVTLFERSSGRQPRLTDAGAALLEEAREVLRQCQRLEGRALGLVRGEHRKERNAADQIQVRDHRHAMHSIAALTAANARGSGRSSPTRTSPRSVFGWRNRITIHYIRRPAFLP